MNETYAHLYHEDAFRPWVAAPKSECANYIVRDTFSDRRLNLAYGVRDWVQEQINNGNIVDPGGYLVVLVFPDNATMLWRFKVEDVPQVTLRIV